MFIHHFHVIACDIYGLRGNFSYLYFPQDFRLKKMKVNSCPAIIKA